MPEPRGVSTDSAMPPSGLPPLQEVPEVLPVEQPPLLHKRLHGESPLVRVEEAVKPPPLHASSGVGKTSRHAPYPASPFTTTLTIPASPLTLLPSHSVSDFFEGISRRAREMLARPESRGIMGYGLALFGTVCGGVIFPLSDMYQGGVPPIVKAGLRNLLLALLYVGLCVHALRNGLADGWISSVPTKFRVWQSRWKYVLIPLAGFTNGVSAILGQVAVERVGDGVAAVITNAPCIFAVLFYMTLGEPVSLIERRATYVVLGILTYFVAVVRPSMIGLLAGLAMSAVSAIHYMAQKRLRKCFPFIPLMAITYTQSFITAYVISRFTHPSLTVADWLFGFWDNFLLTLAVAFFLALFQGCLVLAVSFCSAVVVTGAMSLEPLATFLIDWFIGRPLPDTHTLVVLLLLMAGVTCIAVGSTAAQKPTETRRD